MDSKQSQQNIKLVLADNRTSSSGIKGEYKQYINLNSLTKVLYVKYNDQFPRCPSCGTQEVLYLFNNNTNRLLNCKCISSANTFSKIYDKIHTGLYVTGKLFEDHIDKGNYIYWNMNPLTYASFRTVPMSQVQGDLKYTTKKDGVITNLLYKTMNDSDFFRCSFFLGDTEFSVNNLAEYQYNWKDVRGGAILKSRKFFHTIENTEYIFEYIRDQCDSCLQQESGDSQANFEKEN